jgi:3',5'-cyclic AMP phosphodiesterase CpdA
MAFDIASLVQITDTHILPPGELLYGVTDTAAHLRETILQINRMRPEPDLLLITGDLIEGPCEASYQHFIELIKPLEIPVYVIPGNHDDPQMMIKEFADTPYFPTSDDTFQYTIEDSAYRVLALNSHADGTELPEFDEMRLAWLRDQLEQSSTPVLIAIHHPPLTAGIELIDMGGSEWFQGLKFLLQGYPQVRLVICGHCHIDLSGRIGHVPVYMAGGCSHQLIAARGINIAPSTINAPAPVVLHQLIDGDFLSGSYPWPENVDVGRIDISSGVSWAKLKAVMMGSRS